MNCVFRYISLLNRKHGFATATAREAVRPACPTWWLRLGAAWVRAAAPSTDGGEG
jgi:hypothetical protein